MNTDNHFFDLALKVVTGQATAAEQAELSQLITADPKLQAEFEQLKIDVGLAKEIMPLINATEATAATTGKMPEYARERLRTKVRETLGSKSKPSKPAKVWRWWTRLATAGAAIVVMVAVVWITRPDLDPAPTTLIQIAMLDSIGSTRGSDSKPLSKLQQQWKDARATTFEDTAKLNNWQENWAGATSQTVVKIVYNRDTQELRITIRTKGNPPVEKVFAIKDDQDLPRLLNEADQFIREKTR